VKAPYAILLLTFIFLQLGSTMASLLSIYSLVLSMIFFLKLSVVIIRHDMCNNHLQLEVQQESPETSVFVMPEGQTLRSC
jgi:hypothetical protein